jgi:hypothetical protein
MAKATKPKQLTGAAATGKKTAPKVSTWRPARNLTVVNTGTKTQPE